MYITRVRLPFPFHSVNTESCSEYCKKAFYIVFEAAFGKKQQNANHPVDFHPKVMLYYRSLVFLAD